MSRATKRKHVIKEVLQDDLVVPSEGQRVVRIVASRGNNLHEAETPQGTQFLISMPTKFRRNVWIKRGDFVLVEPIAEGDKVKAEIVGILTPEHVRFFKSNHCWPAEFQTDQSESVGEDLFVNTNRRVLQDDSSASDTSDEDTSASDTSDEGKNV